MRGTTGGRRGGLLGRGAGKSITKPSCPGLSVIEAFSMPRYEGPTIPGVRMASPTGSVTTLVRAAADTKGAATRVAAINNVDTTRYLRNPNSSVTRCPGIMRPPRFIFAPSTVLADSKSCHRDGKDERVCRSHHSLNHQCANRPATPWTRITVLRQMNASPHTGHRGFICLASEIIR